MHLNAQRPIFAPEEYWKEIEQMSKAALMDMVWDYAMQHSLAGGGLGAEDTMKEFRARRDIILTHRKQDRHASIQATKREGT